MLDVMWLAIRDAFRDVAASDARCVVLTGANGDFCSGADVVHEARRQLPTLGGQRLDRHAPARRVGRRRPRLPVPVIAKVDGVAVGAGFGLALAADMLWCSDRARMSAVFAKLGLSLDYGCSWLLAKRLGLHRAKEVALTAEMMDAARIERAGLRQRRRPGRRARRSGGRRGRAHRQRPPGGAVDDEAHARQRRAARRSIHALETEAIAQNVNLGSGPGRGPDGLRREARPRFPGPLTAAPHP